MPDDLPPLLTSLPFRPFDFLAQVAAVIITCMIIPKFKITGILGPALLVLALGAINAAYWSPSLFYAVPDSLSMRTVVLLLINGGIFWALVKILPNMEISGIFAAIASPVAFSVISALISTYGRGINYTVVFIKLSEFVGLTFAYLRHIVGG